MTDSQTTWHNDMKRLLEEQKKKDKKMHQTSVSPWRGGDRSGASSQLNMMRGSMHSIPGKDLSLTGIPVYQIKNQSRLSVQDQTLYFPSKSIATESKKVNEDLEEVSFVSDANKKQDHSRLPSTKHPPSSRQR